jgi:glycosyltransferase involved in cell wall biosynthesis
MVSTYLTSEGGVSSYTKSLVSALREYGINVIVFSDKPKNKALEQSDRGVYAAWSRGILFPFQIFKMLVVSSHVDVVHVQHEFFLYGGMFSAVLFPLLLMLIRLTGLPVVVTMHGVVPLSELDEQFKDENGLKGPLPLLKFGLIFLTKLIVFLSDAVVVHGSFLAETLRKEYKCSEQKIHVIPHGVKKAIIMIPQEEAKKRLKLEGKTVILFFGYISKYKGIETLIEAFGQLAKKHQDWVLVVGGGKHPRLRLDPKYKEYIMKLQQMAHSLAPKQVIFTGFIPNEELPLYFSAADLVVFPYTIAMSSSGPLALSMSYQKPVIASNILSFIELIPFKEVLFKRNSPRDLAEKLELVLNSYDLRHKISAYFEGMKKKNSWSNVALQMQDLYMKLITKK